MNTESHPAAYPPDQTSISPSTPANEEAHLTPSQLQIIIWAALLALALFVSLWNYQSFQLGTWHDDANYVILAQSLLESDTYGQINKPGEPTKGRYPFGYPLILTPLMALFPGDMDVLKLLSLAATLINGGLLFWQWRLFSRRSYWWALAVTGIYLIAPLTIEHTRMIMAEPIFTLFCLTAVITAEQAAQKKESRFWLGLISLSLVFVGFTRTIGFVLVAGTFLYLIWRRGWGYWKKLVRVSIVMILLVTAVLITTPVRVTNGLFPARYLEGANATFINAVRSVFNPASAGETLSERYVDPEPDTNTEARVDKKTLLSDFLLGLRIHLGEDVRLAVIQIGSGDRDNALASRLGLPWLAPFFGYVISAVVLFGFFWTAVKSRLSAFILFALLYLGTLMIWVWKGPRLLYPILPQLFFGFLLGIEAILAMTLALLKQTRRHRLVPAFLTLLVLLTAGFYLEKDLTMKDSRVYVGDLQARSAWIKQNTAKNVIVLSEDPYVDYLYSERKTVRMPELMDSAADLAAFLQENKINYVLLASKRAWQDEGFHPFYSEDASHILPYLNDLSADGRVSLVFTADSQLVKVFQVQP